MGKTIYVRRSVLSAAQRLERLADSSPEANPIGLAELRINDCQAAGDKAGIKFWRAVWTHLMLTKYTPGKITIFEDEEGRKTQLVTM